MTGLTPTDIFPLNYPKGDTTIPEKGAKAVPFILDWSKDNNYTANLLQVRDQKFFGSLRCLWIDASLCTQNFTVAVNGTEQIFSVIAGTTNYYPVINLNVPVVTFAMVAKEASVARIICLNFVPAVAAPSQVTFPGSVVVSGNVAVTNFPATQNVNIVGQAGSVGVTVSNFPATQPISGTVAVSNFPATQPVSGTVGVNNFPVSQPVTGTFWQATQPVSIAGTVSGNIAQYGGVATSLGSKVSASSIPIVIASDQLSIAVSSAANVFPTLTLSTNVAQILTGPLRTFIRSIYIVNVGAVLAAGSVTLSITDGSGFVRYSPVLPVAATTASQPYTVVDIPLSSIPLVNNGNNVMVALSASLTSGSFVITCGVSLV